VPDDDRQAPSIRGSTLVNAPGALTLLYTCCTLCHRRRTPAVHRWYFCIFRPNEQKHSVHRPTAAWSNDCCHSVHCGDPTTTDSCCPWYTVGYTKPWRPEPFSTDSR